jgi:diguanylate cyclase (GGDEF)-like protein/PAS domain S-box-containing protein
MIANFARAFQNALKAITSPILALDAENSLQEPLKLGSQILLAFQKIARIRVSQSTAAQQLQDVLEIIAETFRFPIGFIEQYEEDLEQLRIVAVHGRSLTPAMEVATSSSQTLSGTVLSTRQPMIWAELGDPLALTQLRNIEGLDETFQTVLSVPLIVHQTVVGVLTLAHPEHKPLGDYGVQWLENLVIFAAELLEVSHREEMQLHAQERLDLAALGMHGVLYDLNLEQRQISRTEGLVSLLGYDESEVSPSLDWWLNLIHPEDRFNLITFLEEDALNQREYSLNYRVRRQNHLYLALCDRGIVRRNALGEPVRLVGMISESASVSEQPSVPELPSIADPQLVSGLQAERILLATDPPTEMLDLSVLPPVNLPPADRLDPSLGVLGQIQDVIFQTDLDGHWTFLNPAWTALTGFAVADVLGQPWRDFVCPEDRPIQDTTFASLIAGQKTPRQHQLRYLTHKGDTRWMEIHCQPIIDTEGNTQGLAGTLFDITERKTSESQLLHDAMHDGLTHLPNRVLFMDRLQHTHQNYQRHRENSFAVLFLDLDRFKLINDSLGHIAGDELLQAVAKRLRGCLRPGDTVARFGGDEFTVLLPNVKQVENAVQVSDRILIELGRSFTLAGTEIYTSASIGIALSNGPEQNPEDLLRNADIALYRAKSSGKGRYEVFAEAMHVRALERLEIETDLRRALDRQELQVYYQPIHHLPSHQLAGFEALLRWAHPTRGILEPSEFLAVAEEAGLLTSMGWWVVESACNQLRTWQEDCNLPSQIFMSVNLSHQQVSHADFMAHVQQALSASKILHHSLMLEVGEGVFVEEGDGAIAKLKQLKDSGVQICLDEFGRRFSSFSDLVRLPLNALKIDRALVSEMQMGNNLETIRAIITLGHKLGLRVIAEGVEVEPQVAQIQALKCDSAQGQFFSLASPAEGLSYLLDQKFFANTSILPMRTLTSSPVLVLKTSTHTSRIPLNNGRSWSLGRSVDSTVVLSDRWVSRDHAEIQLMDNSEYYLVDLGSGNGSFVNGQRVTMPVHLKEGDLLTIGRTEIEFQSLHPDSPTQLQDTSPKTVLITQASQYQGDIWREVLTSQGISLMGLSSEVDLQQLIEQRAQAGEPLPDLLLLDMTTLRPNPYSFCRWCHAQYPQLKIVLTSGTRTDVPSSERQWAIYQGALDLLPAFPDSNLFSSLVNTTAKVRAVLKVLNANPISQQSFASTLMSIQSVLERGTVLHEGLPKGTLR